jgi:Uma2 family endonuclease
MSALLKPRYTVEEYLARERDAVGKSEYYRGQIFAMAGGSLRHNAISVNLVISLGGRLRGSSCRPCNSDQRIRIPANGLATYPDVSVVCGEVQVDAEDRDAIINPRIIFEVLSKSTESYDRGKKFDLYRQLDSLHEYILVNQDEPQVERFVRQQDGSWVLNVFKGLPAMLELQSIAAGALPLSEIYENVTFGLEEELAV